MISKKKLLLATTIILAIIAVSSIAAATYVWTGTVAISTPTARSDTFTVSAMLNGTAVANPNAINLPTPLYTGDIYVINYTITSTANQPITVNESGAATGNSIWSWDKTSLALAASGSSGLMDLTITIGTTTGTINVQFTATP